jgi:mono/diheme cytochrome c family protein
MRYLVIFVLGAVLPIVAIIALALSGLLPIHATAAPSWIESKIAGSAMDARLEREARGLQNPLKPTDEVLLAGLKSYRNGCAGCHGLPGKPSAWGTKDFYPPVPQFADNPPDMPAPQMFLVVKHGVRYTGMAAWDGQITEQEMWQVVTFLSRIKNLPPSVAAAWTAAPTG